ncbi:hypothetical protein BH23CYA1_BH23CYA1_20640 [soil metagenome]
MTWGELQDFLLWCQTPEESGKRLKKTTDKLLSFPILYGETIKSSEMLLTQTFYGRNKRLVLG